MKIDSHQGIFGGFSYEALGPGNSTGFLRERTGLNQSSRNQMPPDFSKATLESRRLEPCFQNDFQLKIPYAIKERKKERKKLCAQAQRRNKPRKEHMASGTQVVLHGRGMVQGGQLGQTRTGRKAV